MLLIKLATAADKRRKAVFYGENPISQLVYFEKYFLCKELQRSARLPAASAPMDTRNSRPSAVSFSRAFRVPFAIPFRRRDPLELSPRLHCKKNMLVTELLELQKFHLFRFFLGPDASDGC